MIISLIAAATENNVIGKNDDLPWKLPDDMKYFVQTTKGHHILTGRKNLGTFGKLLPDRTTMVLTRDKDFTFEGAFIFHEIEKAIEFAKKNDEEELMIIGGGEIYKLALSYADRIYLTRIHTELEGDTYFPEIDEDEWDLVSTKFHDKDERHAYAFTYEVYERE